MFTEECLNPEKETRFQTSLQNTPQLVMPSVTASPAEGWYGDLRDSNVNLIDMVKNDYSGFNLGYYLCFSNIFIP